MPFPDTNYWIIYVGNYNFNKGKILFLTKKKKKKKELQNDKNISCHLIEKLEKSIVQMEIVKSL